MKNFCRAVGKGGSSTFMGAGAGMGSSHGVRRTGNSHDDRPTRSADCRGQKRLYLSLSGAEGRLAVDH
jgi:hypothetical protein